MGFTRHEMRYGSFTRTLPLTDGATESEITASYKDGILQIRVPVADRRPKKAPTTIPVAIG
jgi:HSP20 family protein